jgi:SpoVK/Ycf46/Vps4 family AAA+-type ATPase
MYTEILKIIEGGLGKDLKKIKSFSILLAEKLRKDGDEKMAKMIIELVEKNQTLSNVTLDELVTSPVDQESRMDIVDLYIPEKKSQHLVFDKLLENKINNFIKTVKHSKDLLKAGVEAQNTLLLYGTPGGGKTSVAKFISQQTGLPLVIARFDAIVSSLLGNTAKNIRKIFDFADDKPCILFLDEFDAIAKARDDQYELGELKRVINSLLQNIDRFSKNNILIAATNHPELLDKAIWRRFNTVIEIGKPAEEEINALLHIYFKDYKTNFLGDKKKTDKLVKLLNGKTPADIKSIINNVIANSIINKSGAPNYEDVLIEIYSFDHHGTTSIDQLITFLNNNGISHAAIAEYLEISLRQVRNVIYKE